MIKKISFIFFAVFSLWMVVSCRSEVEAVQDRQVHERHHDRITFKTFREETKIKRLGDAFFGNGEPTRSTTQGGPLSRFLVDTVNINRIVANGSLSTYAFRIYSVQEAPEVLYNLVYRRRADGSVHYAILKIAPSRMSLVYDSEKGAGFGRPAHAPNTSKVPCTSVFIESFHCKNGHSWENCDHCADCVSSVEITYGDCGGGSSGGMVPGGWPSPPATGGGSPTYPSPYPTSPPLEGGGGAPYEPADPSGYVFDPSEEPSTDPAYVRAYRAHSFWMQLAPELKLFASQLATDLYLDILENYLNNFKPGSNDGNLAFHNWALDFLKENPETPWERFKDWFIDGGNLSDTAMLDFTSDLSNPTTVKPTKRFKNNTLLYCIYNKAKNSANFNQYLKNFDSRFSVAHLQFDVKSISNSSLNAQTSPPQDYWIKIDINSNNLDRPYLDIARTLMHEIIHAEMFRILLSLAPTSNGQINSLTLFQMLQNSDYPGLLDYYVRYGGNGMQHEQMAAHYRGIIKNFLKQIDNSITNSQAEAIAWIGLQGTVAWNNIGLPAQNNIINTYNNWYNSATHNCQ